MAATSLWHIEGRLKDLISYVENPEKTVPNKEMQDFFDVFSYVKNPEKTDNGEFVSAINCLKETALTNGFSEGKHLPLQNRKKDIFWTIFLCRHCNRKMLCLEKKALSG